MCQNFFVKNTIYENTHRHIYTVCVCVLCLHIYIYFLYVCLYMSQLYVTPLTACCCRKLGLDWHPALSSAATLTIFVFISKAVGSCCGQSDCGLSAFILALLTALGGRYTNHSLCHGTYGRQIRAFSPGIETTTSSLHVLCTLPSRPALRVCGRVKAPSLFNPAPIHPLWLWYNPNHPLQNSTTTIFIWESALLFHTQICCPISFSSFPFCNTGKGKCRLYGWTT